jgi:hypothetical protein
LLDAVAVRLGLIAPGRRRRFGEPLDDAELDAFVQAPFPRVPAARYDRERPADAPSSKELTERFGKSWPRACRAVWGLMADGRYAGCALPWQNMIAGRPRIRYTDEECIAALRACARRFGVVPTVTL